MKTTLINLLVLDMFINDYPGVNSTADLADPGEPCPEGWRVRGGYIIYEPGNFHFSQSAAEAIAEGWEWHAATEITSCIGTFVVSNYIVDVLVQINSCCGSGNIQTQALILKVSPYSLSPEEPDPPCQTPAEFIWLAIHGSNDVRNMEYFFFIQLTSADNLISIGEYFVDTVVFTETVQHNKKWPEDFIGLTIGGITLVANDVVPGVDERNIGDFDGGIILISIEIQDTDLELPAVPTVTQEFRLPDTDCEPAFALRMTADIPINGHTIDLVSSPFGPTHQMFVDWGDGSAEEEFNGALINASHLYVNAGIYIIQVRYGTGFGPASFSAVDNLYINSVIFGTQLQSYGTQFLDFTGNQLTDDSFEFSGVPTGLLTLVLADNIFTPAIMPLPATLDQVFNLVLNGNDMDGISGADIMTQLTQLYMNNCSLNAINFTGYAGTLIELAMSGNNIIVNPIVNLSDLSNFQLLDITDNALTPAEVDAILVQLDTAGFSFGTVSLEGQTPAAPPTGTGLAAKASLEGKGWTVNVDV